VLYIPDYPVYPPRRYLSFNQRDSSQQPKTWARHFADIVLGEQSGLDFAELRDHYLKDFRKRIGHRFAEDALQDLMLAVLANIENDNIREPGRLVLCVQKSFADVTAEYKERAQFRRLREKGFCKARKMADAETTLDQFLDENFRAFVQQNLCDLGPQARELLERLYVQDESPTEIQAAMKLTPRDFATLHWMSKTKFRERLVIKRQAENRGLVPWVCRLSAYRPRHGSTTHWGFHRAEPVLIFAARPPSARSK